MMKIAICDDDRTQSEYIRSRVLSWAAQNDTAVTVGMYASARALLFEDYKAYAIFLLDIEMAGMNGIELAKIIRQHHETAVIVFITGYADYIAEGYDVSALHYLMKPLNSEKLFAVLDKAVHTLGRSERCLMLEVSGETYRVPLREIRYLEVSGNYVTIHAKQDIRIKQTLAQLHAQLDDRFTKTGRSHLVNIAYIRRITKTDVYLSSGEAVPLSRGAYEAVNRAVIERA